MVHSPPIVDGAAAMRLMVLGKSVSYVREDWGMGLALMVVIWLITLASTYFFVAKTWWLPVGASAATGFICLLYTSNPAALEMTGTVGASSVRFLLSL